MPLPVHVATLPLETLRLIEAVKTAESLPLRPMAERPLLKASLPASVKLDRISRYILSFEYNHTGRAYFQLKRDRGVKHISTTAKEIMREALPIQCVEAVFLAFFLTAGSTEFERYPLSFKTRTKTKSYRHIVLAAHHLPTMTWGALGLSRRKDLMQKDVRFKTLADLVRDYETCYLAINHTLLKVYVGLPFPHDTHSDESVKWRVLKLNFSDETKRKSNDAMLDDYAKHGPYLRDYFKRTGHLPMPYGASSHPPKKNNSDDNNSKEKVDVGSNNNNNDDASSTNTTPPTLLPRCTTSRRASLSIPIARRTATATTRRRKSDSLLPCSLAKNSLGRRPRKTPIVPSPPLKINDKSLPVVVLKEEEPPCCATSDEAAFDMVFSPSPSSPGGFPFSDDICFPDDHQEKEEEQQQHRPKKETKEVVTTT